MAWKIRSLVPWACSALTLIACETTDPCALRQAACLDVVLIGAPDPVFYRGLTVTISVAAGGAPLAPPTSIPELRSTAPAGVQGLVTFQLPASFNDLMDIAPDKVVGEIQDTDAKIAKLDELRGKDLRAIRILVEGTESGGGADAKVRWDSKVEEETRLKAAKDDGNTDQWLQLRYFRVGKNKYEAAYATLDRVP